MRPSELRITFETEIERISRMYAALSRINKAIVRVPQREELFTQVCDALVDDGGFRLAWIGWHDSSSRRLVPVAVSGDEHDYLARIEVRTDDSPEGAGPSGQAFSLDRAYVCNDVLADPATLPWRAELERSELRASAVFPIHVGGRVGGTSPCTPIAPMCSATRRSLSSRRPPPICRSPSTTSSAKRRASALTRWSSTSRRSSSRRMTRS